MQGVILLLFAKYYHLPFLRDVQTDCTRTGLGGYWVSMGTALEGTRPQGVYRLVPWSPKHRQGPLPFVHLLP